jgi:hypothetical protein
VLLAFSNAVLRNSTSLSFLFLARTLIYYFLLAFIFRRHKAADYLDATIWKQGASPLASLPPPGLAAPEVLTSQKPVA